MIQNEGPGIDTGEDRHDAGWGRGSRFVLVGRAWRCFSATNHAGGARRWASCWGRGRWRGWSPVGSSAGPGWRPCASTPGPPGPRAWSPPPPPGSLYPGSRPPRAMRAAPVGGAGREKAASREQASATGEARSADHGPAWRIRVETRGAASRRPSEAALWRHGRRASRTRGRWGARTQRRTGRAGPERAWAARCAKWRGRWRSRS